ncbi:MAG: hypothetical protein ACO3UM_06135 [Planctomycetota bacterium]
MHDQGMGDGADLVSAAAPDAVAAQEYGYSLEVTPPFTEAVDWVVLERIFEAGPEQVRALNRIEGNNARHVQSLEGRKGDAQRSAGF